MVCQRLRSSLTPRSRRRAISASSDLRSGRAGPILMRGTGAQDDWRLERRAPGLPLSPVATRYTRVPSTFFEPSLSLRRLHTTPARKPRTECCCQPVACIMVAIVAPAGDCSMAMMRDCFEPGSAFLPLGSIVSCCGAFAAPPAAYGAAERFLTDFDIKILRSVKAASTPHHRSPTSAIRPAGQDLGAPSAPGIGDTTAPIAAECQSFLDNVIAQCGRT